MRAGFFYAADGLKLPYQWYAPAGPVRAGLIVVHGYADHAGRYAHLARRLSPQGYAVMAFDYRGHGQAEGSRGHCQGFEEFVSDLERACTVASGELPDRPLGLVAHSHGGLVALRFLCDPERVSGAVQVAVLSAPYLGLKMGVAPLTVALARLASRIAPKLAMDNGLRSWKLSRDSEMVRARDNDALVHRVATARWFTEARAAQRQVAACVGRLSLPTLWLVAGADQIADPEVTRQLYGRAGGDKELQVYDGFYHELFHDLGREQVFRDVEAWLASRFPM